MQQDELINDLKAHVADGDVVAIVGAEFRSRPPVATHWLAGRGSCSTAWSMGKPSPAPSQSPKADCCGIRFNPAIPTFSSTPRS